MTRADALAVWQDLTRELWPTLDPNQLAEEADGTTTISSALMDLCVPLAKAGSRGPVHVSLDPVGFRALVYEMAARQRYGISPVTPSPGAGMTMHGPGSIDVSITPSNQSTIHRTPPVP